jgi:Arc/MetJ-type ribon-helix-helix transcriptional regulator
MNINFPPVDENFIKKSVGVGLYSNANELVRDAVVFVMSKRSARMYPAYIQGSRKKSALVMLIE